MNVLKDDIFKNKYFMIVFSVLGLLIAYVYLINNYFSIEARCRRAYTGSSMKSYKKESLMQMALESAIEPSIQECIRNGGP